MWRTVLMYGALLAQGQSNKQIAQRLEVSPNTVKSHLASLFAKLEVARRTEAILRARELGLKGVSWPN